DSRLVKILARRNRNPHRGEASTLKNTVGRVAMRFTIAFKIGIFATLLIAATVAVIGFQCYRNSAEVDAAAMGRRLIWSAVLLTAGAWAASLVFSRLFT